MALLRRTIELLERAGIPAALIGASAMAAHGVSRSTLDQDLIVTDTSILSASFWSALGSDVSLDVRRGDDSDPLLGVVRLHAPEHDRHVDVVVGPSWTRGVVDRAERVELSGVSLRVATSADLILLKLYAGGPQDLWDIAQLLSAAPDADALRAEVEARLSLLPTSCTDQWKRL
ncbi:MAG TPA: hypothetical protein VM364_12145 [Vicinamibacterales bacterium]|nr:hypothetical protein [Vicinamibacterales bacterium]